MVDVEQHDLAQRRFWAYAAAFGALWGAFEITVGAFLHTLRMPLTGMLLATLGGALLVAERQLLSLRGLTLATGAVAALCKSLSPGGVILGPMIGILLEAALVEAALLLAPRSRPSAALAGALSAGMAVSQKLLTQVIVYGGDILALYLALLRKLAAGLHLDPGTGWGVVAGIATGCLLLGAAGGLAGRRLGVRCRAQLALAAGDGAGAGGGA